MQRYHTPFGPEPSQPQCGVEAGRSGAVFWLETAMSTLPGRDHTSGSTPSLDGKGGTESALKGGKSTKRTGPSYVYYRLYTKLGAFESNHALYHNNRFIGRVPSNYFAPPHTVASIKRSLCKIEGLSEPDKALVFTPLSSPAPKEDSARLSFALINFAVYYRVYLSEGKRDEKTKTSFDESDISLGRINTLFIAPPHSVGSLKAHIAKVEGLVTPGHALYKEMELFQDMNSDAAMSDTDVISFSGDTFPGSDEGDPVALVNATTNTVADQKTKPTSDGPDSKFTKCARVTCATNSHPAYMVINSKGEKGYVETGTGVLGTDGHATERWRFAFTSWDRLLRSGKGNANALLTCWQFHATKATFRMTKLGEVVSCGNAMKDSTSLFHNTSKDEIEHLPEDWTSTEHVDVCDSWNDEVYTCPMYVYNNKGKPRRASKFRSATYNKSKRHA
ncbi:uncharacterized protein LACBIDRAFT_328206 [Laccaria bicolor S238N-H82]|uniref:Predicted protein n=1 Tax=Laccaria bicolor (strain S238N-H82 / ATCC MYA-4686) TaxID=486041 RepID=B0DE27_LACBS|nr:uncharacterized protein LACBIDRAFT_328206 [Laccaria bicolor S238N-H82]EDR07191.1 predicted protein [Laccaria bicolor S238N-H82]|eukprot:XP_001882122.1 predicted protein [Laccaria bicolor S238N-H82]